MAPDTASSILDLYRQIWRFAAGTRGKLVGAMLLLSASQLVKLALPYATARAIDSLQKGGPGSIAHAGLWVAALLGIYILAWGLHGPGRVLERAVGVRVRETLSDALYQKLTHAPLAWHEQHHSGELQHRLAQSSGSLSSFAQTQFVYVQSFISFVGPLVALVLLSPSIGVMALIGYAVVAVLIARFDSVLMRLAVQENHAERRYASGLLDFIGNIGTVASLRLQEPTRQLIAARLRAIFGPLRRLIVLNEVKWGAVDIISVALTWTLVGIYAWQASGSTETLMLGALFMIYQYAQQASGVIASMASNFQTVARTRTDVASAAPIWQAPESPQDPGLPTSGSLQGWSTIEVNDLSYSRGEGSRGVLDHVSLALRRGERVALVGPSGSGKSTMMRVLAGLYEPASSQVRVDGHLVPDVHHLGSVSTLIPQEAEVFESTVRENITFGAPHDEAAVMAAVHVSAFDDTLAGMAQGLDTPISERGFNMSGGQRQRLSLARGVLAAQGSAVIFLDEPTSALDAITEAAVIERLGRHFPDACLVVSVHRMSLLERFDRVVLMEDGHILDEGPVHQVAARQPLLADMLRGRKDAPKPAAAPAATGSVAPI